MGDFACAVVKKQQLENIYAPTPRQKEIIIYAPRSKKIPYNRERIGFIVGDYIA